MPRKGIKWTIKKITEGFDSFYKNHGRYPTSTEIDQYAKLPSARQIQRRFVGGIPALRKQLGLKGQNDFTKGEYSSQRAHMINQRAHKIEKEVYKYLIKIFGQPFVHREYFFNDDRRNRTDFYVYHNKGTFSVDTFYPNSLINLNNCLNSKLSAYKNLNIEYPIIFLMMNDLISEEEITSLIENKKNKLRPNQSIMTFKQFKLFCSTRGRAQIKD